LSEPRKGWREAAAAYLHPRVRTMLFLGFSSGLAFPMVLTTLSARLRLAGIDRSTIGFFSLVGLAYSLKFFWSPIVDRVRLPLLHRLGRRRSWMLVAQCCVAGGLVAMALHDPKIGPVHMALLAVLTAFAAATQDIAVDAFRIEAAGTELQGSMAAAYQIGYQVALICGGAGALFAASAFGWQTSYLLIAGCMSVGVATTLSIAEPQPRARQQQAVDRALLERVVANLRPEVLLVATIAAGLAAAQGVVGFSLSLAWSISLSVIFLLIAALTLVRVVPSFRPALERLTTGVVLPFVDFFARFGWRTGLPILALIVTFRLNYMTMGVAANPFYVDMGFTLDQIAVVSKIYGVIMTIAGGLIAGALVATYGAQRTMLVGWCLLTAANLFYAHMATDPPQITTLAIAISVDNLGNGIAGGAFIAYMSSLTSLQFTATQYALFGTLWSLPAKSIASFWGTIVDAIGYPLFFCYTAAIGVPSLLLILYVMRRPPRPSAAA